MTSQTLERPSFPKTVTACHAEIVRLRVAIEAINNFLYEVERPPGQFKFDVIHGPAADCAIIRLFDAAGCQP